MEMNNTEIKVITEADAKANEGFLLDLTHLELAFCGGGVGEVVLA
jgi:hypothetical protein